jgi:hypothetical protein
VSRAEIPGRDPRRELRLEYVQIRELTNFIACASHALQPTQAEVSM